MRNPGKKIVHLFLLLSLFLLTTQPITFTAPQFVKNENADSEKGLNIGKTNEFSKKIDNPSSLIYAKIYSAVLPLNSQKTLLEIQNYALENGSIELIGFDPEKGHSNPDKFKLIYLGKPHVGYPGFTVGVKKTYETALQKSEIVIVGDHSTSPLQLPGTDFELLFQVPMQRHEPFRATVQLNKYTVSQVEIYETRIRNIPHSLPKIICAKFFDSEIKVIQLFNYDLENEEIEFLTSEPPPDRKDSSEDTEPKDSVSDYPVTQGNQAIISKPVNFQGSWGEPGTGFNTGWQPGVKKGAYPIQIKCEYSAGAGGSSEINGNFKLYPQDEKLKVGTASGKLSFNVGASSYFVLYLNIPLGFGKLEKTLDVNSLLGLPNFDLSATSQKNFPTYLLGGKSVTLADTTETKSLLDVPLNNLLLLAGITLPLGFKGSVKFNGNLELQATMGADSITTSDGLTFTEENQLLEFLTETNYYQTTLYYNENHWIKLILNIYPTISVSIGRGWFKWTYSIELKKLPCTIMNNQKVNIPFSPCTVKFNFTRTPEVTCPSLPGISLRPGNVYTIRWKGFSGPSVKISLQKGGSFLQTIVASTENDRKYRWTVPTNLSPDSDYRIKIRSISNPSESDVSDNPFDVSSEPKIIYPSAKGIIWKAGKIYKIKWAGIRGPMVRMDLLKGSTRLLSKSISNKFSYDWEVPESLVTGSDYRVKLTAALFMISSDSAVSDNPFTIKNEPEMIYPSAKGITWETGQTYNIQWRRLPGFKVKIELYRLSNLYQTIRKAAINKGSYKWKVPNDLNPSKQYRIKVSNLYNSSEFAISDNYFSVQKPLIHDLALMDFWFDPDPLKVGQEAKLYAKIKNEGNTKELISLTVFINFKKQKSALTSEKDLGIQQSVETTYILPGQTKTLSGYIPLYRIPSEPGTYNCTIEIPSVFGEKDELDNKRTEAIEVVELVVPKITVTYPNGGETWQCGSMYNITWTSSGNVGSRVRIELYKGASKNRTISSSTENDGSYGWSVPADQLTASNFRIKITSTSYFSYCDYSDNYFTISSAPTITVTSPNGGEWWYLGDTRTITWDSSGNVGSNVKIELYDEDAMVHTISSSTENDGSYSWFINLVAPGISYRIKITSTSSPSIYDYSDNYFFISVVASPRTAKSGHGTFNNLRHFAFSVID